MSKQVDVYVGNGLGDFVRCNDCNTLMLLPCSADKCPKCNAEWTLTWACENHNEMSTKELRKMDYTVLQHDKLDIERYLSQSTIDMEEISDREKVDYLPLDVKMPRYCPECREMAMMSYEGAGKWLCWFQQDDDDSRDEAKPKNCKAMETWFTKNDLSADVLIALCKLSVDGLREKCRIPSAKPPIYYFCPECQKEALRYAMIDRDGTNLEEGYSCSECGAEFIGLDNEQIIEANR